MHKIRRAVLGLICIAICVCCAESSAQERLKTFSDEHVLFSYPANRYSKVRFGEVTEAVFVNVVVASHHAHCFNSARGARSGLSQTSFFNSQLRVERDHRCGLPAFACA